MSERRLTNTERDAIGFSIKEGNVGFLVNFLEKTKEFFMRGRTIRGVKNFISFFSFWKKKVNFFV
jgi:hypothetical protein